MSFFRRLLVQNSTQQTTSKIVKEKREDSKKSRSKASNAKSEKVVSTADTKHSIPATKTLTPKMKIVVEALECLKEHRSYAHLYAPNADVLFQEAPMTMSGIEDEFQKQLKSFPDFQVEVHDLFENQDESVTAVISTCGTHTGDSYGFGPYPEIPTSNIRVQNSRESITASFNDDGMIIKVVIEPLDGEMTGPAGFYTQIGGIIF